MNEGASDLAPFSEYLFEMLYQLCKEYPAFTPLQLDNERYHKVIALYADTKKVQMRYDKQKAETQPCSGVIRRPAGDTWF